MASTTGSSQGLLWLYHGASGPHILYSSEVEGFCCPSIPVNSNISICLLPPPQQKEDFQLAPFFLVFRDGGCCRHSFLL